jgi:hypothetical protein
VSTDVSEEHIAWIFKVEEYATQETSETLKMEKICSSEMSGGFQRATRRYIPEDNTLHNHRCENLKSFTYSILFTTMSEIGSKILQTCIQVPYEADDKNF